MSDNLTVFGTDFVGVTGIKATGTGNGTLTYIRPQGTKSISANGTGIDVTEYASVDVAVVSGVDIPSFEILWDSSYSSATVTCNKTFAECYALWHDGKNGASYHASVDNPEDTWEDNGVVTEMGGDSAHVDYVANGNYGPIFDLVYHSDGTIDHVQPSSYAIELSVTQNGYYYPSSGGVYTSVDVSVPSSTPSLQAKTATPTTSQQTITPDSGYDGLSSVTVDAMPSGTEGTPTATKGTVSNHSVSVTPSVTNTTGYISGGTKTGTAVSVSASELVSGTYTVDSSGTKDVTNYASASISAGTAGTPSASKGTVSNHSVSVTPSVTNQTGWITGSTKTGTAVTVSASELVSGSETKTANGTYDVTNLASLVVAVPFSTIYSGTSDPSSGTGVNGDVYLKTVS